MKAPSLEHFRAQPLRLPPPRPLPSLPPPPPILGVVDSLSPVHPVMLALSDLPTNGTGSMEAC